MPWRSPSGLWFCVSGLTDHVRKACLGGGDVASYRHPASVAIGTFNYYTAKVRRIQADTSLLIWNSLLPSTIICLDQPTNRLKRIDIGRVLVRPQPKNPWKT